MKSNISVAPLCCFAALGILYSLGVRVIWLGQISSILSIWRHWRQLIRDTMYVYDNICLYLYWILILASIYSYFMATRGTVKLLSRGRGGDLGKVARGRRQRATVSQIFSTTEGQWFDCSPSSLGITVLLTQLFKITETLSTVRRCSSLTFCHLICHVTSQECSVDRSTVFFLLPNALFKSILRISDRYTIILQLLG